MSTKSPSMIVRWHPIADKPPDPACRHRPAPRASSRSGSSCFSAPSHRKRRVG